MRKILFAVFLLFFVCPTFVQAASVGGMTVAGQSKVTIGFSEDYIFDKDLKFESTTSDVSGESNLTVKHNIEYMSRSTVDIAYGLLSGLDIYTRLGVVDFNSKAKPSYEQSGSAWSVVETYKGEAAFIHGVGLKGVQEINGFLLGADVQYLQHKNKYKMTEDVYKDGALDSTDSGTGKMFFREWQVALLVGKKFGNFTPYVGGKYSDMSVKIKNTWSDGGTETNKLTAKDNFGAFLGMDYKLSENWKLNLEGRFIDETAVSGSVGFRF